MASIAELLEAQAAILRVQLNAEAAAVSAAATPLDTYVEQLIERAELNSQAALLVFEFITGATPSSTHLDALTAFAETQFNFYNDVLGVANPELGPYEAMGRSLAGTTGFIALSVGKTDAEFIAAVYVQASDPGGAAPSPAQIQHFQDQITFFKALYQGSGIPAATAAEQARGAVLGQIVGLFATQEGSALDNLAENFFRQANAGFAVYGVPLESIPDINAPPPPTGILAVLTDPGGEVLTGTPQDDLFRGGGNDIDATDTLLGLGGQDAAQLFLYSGNQYSLNSVGVEDFFLSPDENDYGDNYYFSFENVEGLETVHLENFDNSMDVYLYDLQNNVDFFFDDFQTTQGNGAGDVYIYFENGVVGEDATLNLDLLDSYLDELSVYTYDDDFFSTLNIIVNGSDAYINLDLNADVGDETLTTLTASGDAYLYLVDDDEEFNGLEVIDFSDLEGGSYFNIEDSTADFTFTGGDGDDYFDVDDGFDENDTADGGDGENTLEVNANQAINISAANVSNFAHLRLDDELTSDVLLVNSAGFDDITLEDQTTNAAGSPGGSNLVLTGFGDVIIQDDQTGSIAILNPEVTITFEAGGDDIDVALLDVSNSLDVTIIIPENYGGYDVDIDTLDLESAALDTDTLTFISPAGDGTEDSGDIFIDNFLYDTTDDLQLVDMSNFHGYFDFDDELGEGTDFLIGDLQATDSELELVDNDNSESEFVFSGTENDWTLYIEGFDADGIGDDTLDLGLLGVDDQTDIAVSDQGAFFRIVANAGQFEGTIELEDNGEIADVAALRARIEFDGGLG